MYFNYIVATTLPNYELIRLPLQYASLGKIDWTISADRDAIMLPHPDSGDTAQTLHAQFFKMRTEFSLPEPEVSPDKDEECTIYRWYLRGLTAVWFIGYDGLSSGLIFHRSDDSQTLLETHEYESLNEFFTIIHEHLRVHDGRTAWRSQLPKTALSQWSSYIEQPLAII